jgi:hypothetical protein
VANTRLASSLAVVCAIVAALAVSGSMAQAPSGFQLTSPAFPQGGNIPVAYTCDGPNRSPALQWSGVPAGTLSFALIVDDPDAPRGTWVHWVLFDIPGTRTELPEGFTPGQVGVSGRNDFGRTGYGGPCPPSGTHRYFFRLHALPEPTLPLREGASRGDVDRAIGNRALGLAQLMGRYSR